MIVWMYQPSFIANEDNKHDVIPNIRKFYVKLVIYHSSLPFTILVHEALLTLLFCSDNITRTAIRSGFAVYLYKFIRSVCLRQH